MILRALLEQALSKESPNELQQFLQEAAGEDWAALQELLLRLAVSPEKPTKQANNQTCDFHLAEFPQSNSPPIPLPTPEHLTPPKVDTPLDGVLFDGIYKLRERLGMGGMGEVYAAEQLSPVRRRVAIKIVKKGMNSTQILHRFGQERQALALMDHPNIAKIYDGGTTPDNQPYFVMEHVKGVSITKYADRTKLSPRDRLALFLPVCYAVQHAHQKGIIHRDLKPSNILVGLVDDKPMPKIIDFGVAKALHGPIIDQSIYTELNTIIGTLEYMSPEQAEFNNLDIDTRSDIYSLGVVLYELLAGVLPFTRQEQLRGSLDEIVKIIREREPLKPSTKISTLKELPEIASRRNLEPHRLKKLLAGDLDWIVMKCLEKERERRYATAHQLAADVERYLRREPVHAAPPSVTYRLKKHLQRHWGKVLLASAMLLLLVAAAVTASLGMLQAMRAEQLAEQEAAVHRALLEFIEKDVFTPLEPFERASMRLPLENEIKVRTLLNRATEQLDQGRFAQQPRVEAAMRLTMGKAYKAIGSYEAALQQVKRAEQLCAAHFGNQDTLPLDVMEMFGQTLCDLERYHEAEAVLGRLVEQRAHLVGPRHAATLRARYLTCSMLRGRGRADQARGLLVALITDQQEVLGQRHVDTLASMGLLALIEVQQGKLAQAEALLNDVLLAYKETAGAEHPAALITMNHLALLLYKRGDFEKAVTAYRRLVASGSRVFGQDHPLVMLFKSNLGACLMGQRRYDLAAPLFEEALPVFHRMDPEHRYTLVLKNNMALIHVENREYRKALALYEAIVPGFRKRFGDSAVNTLDLLRDLTQAYQEAGEIDKSMETAELLLGILKRQSNKAQVAQHLVDALDVLSAGYLHQRKPEKAEKLLQEHLELIPNGHPQRQRLNNILAGVRKPS